MTLSVAYSATMNNDLIRLIAGFRRFKERYFAQDGAEHTLYERLASSGQTPKTLLIGCSDSRVDPAILTDASPGELFVVRNVANLVPPCEISAVGFHGTSSAIEFAVKSLKVENIIILGHRQCGGIRALMNGVTETDSFIGQWMTIAEEARQCVLHDHPEADDETKYRLAEMESLRVSRKNVLSFPFVKDAMDKQNLTVLCIYFDLELGELWYFDDTHSNFREVKL